MKKVDKDTTQRIILLYELIESVAEEFECFDHCQKDQCCKRVELSFNIEDLTDILENDYLSYELEVLQRCGINFVGDPNVEPLLWIRNKTSGKHKNK